MLGYGSVLFSPVQKIAQVWRRHRYGFLIVAELSLWHAGSSCRLSFPAPALETPSPLLFAICCSGKSQRLRFVCRSCSVPNTMFVTGAYEPILCIWVPLWWGPSNPLLLMAVVSFLNLYNILAFSPAKVSSGLNILCTGSITCWSTGSLSIKTRLNWTSHIVHGCLLLICKNLGILNT